MNVFITDCTISGNSTYGGMHAEGAPNLTVTNSTISVTRPTPGSRPETVAAGYMALLGSGLRTAPSAVTQLQRAAAAFMVLGSALRTAPLVAIQLEPAGAVYEFADSLHVTNSTITANSAPSGGGIYNKRGQFGDSVVEISNIILNAGASGENIFNDGGTATSYGYNLSSDDGGGYLTGPGDQINTNPLLGPLQDNGGLTFTQALLPGSPAVDAGNPNFHPPPYDQRGCPFDRVFNGRIDIGSFETQPPHRPCAATPRPRPTPAPRPTPPQ